MRFFPRRHTPKSVAAELIKGLENGTLTLAPPPLDVNDAIAESLKIAALISAAIARVVPEYSPPELPTAEKLASVEKNRPGAVHEFLSTLEKTHTELQRHEAETKYLLRLRLALRVVWLALATVAVACFVYLCLTNPAAAVVGCLSALTTLAVHSFRAKLMAPGRNLTDAKIKLLAAVNDLAIGSRSFS